MPSLTRLVAYTLLASQLTFQLVACAEPTTLPFSPKERDAISAQIYQNECASKSACLTSWNANEHFASMGIGHFIWYPLGANKPYQESFPDFIAFARDRGSKLPEWLEYPGPCPWSSKTEFKAAFYNPRMIELRDYLEENVSLQSDFMLHRLENALNKVERGVIYKDRQTIRQQLERLKQTPQGRYALVDYVNFKGEGLKKTERYNGQGWGLVQVLLHMPKSDNAKTAAKEFAVAADKMLTRRVVNATKMGKPEKQWLPGWRKRVYSYPKFLATQ